jgi:hypothetical protein
MKNLKVLLFVAILVVLAVPMTSVFAAAPAAPALQEASAPTLPDLMETAKNLTGIAMFFAALINAGKSFFPDRFPDSSAPTWSLVTQSLTLFGVIVLQVSGKTDILPAIDANAGILATVITGLVALVYQLFVSRVTHEHVLAGMPVIGESYTNRSAGHGVVAELSFLPEYEDEDE